MSKKPFGKIAAGLNEALAVASGTAKPDEFSLHEVLHMASFLTNAVDEELCQHEVIKSNPELLALAVKADEILGDLYQAIGRVKWEKS